MALINCPSCGAQISETAKRCPKCGYQVKGEHSHIKNKNKKQLHILLFVIGGLLLLIVGTLLVADAIEKNAKQQAHEQYVKDSLEKVRIDSLVERKLKKEEASASNKKTAVKLKNNYDYTDLGLSVLWSNYNVGASDEMDYGNLYGWGNTKTELTTDLNQYPCATPPYSINNTKYDVAQALWGGNWRMPTLAELRELIEYCSWNKVEYEQGIYYKVTGPNGNSILLPLSGYRKGNEYKSVGEWGFIWSSELYDGNSQFASNLSFGGKKGTVETSGYYRYGGESIRPVMDKK